MRVEQTELPGVLLIEPDVFGDERGFFMELYRAPRYAEQGVTADFVQDNLSFSRRGVLRGLHLQHPNGQAKLVFVLQGEVFDVAVDVRLGSPTFGRWAGRTLSAENRQQFFIPEGFAHGFCVTSETVLFSYKCSAVYDAASELAILATDPEIGIDWPLADALLSDKDAAAPRLSEIPRGRLPTF
jgi:dTDP-4-dehydrorhamnose 3,5-epimerase